MQRCFMALLLAGEQDELRDQGYWVKVTGQALNGKGSPCPGQGAGCGFIISSLSVVPGETMSRADFVLESICPRNQEEWQGNLASPGVSQMS